MKPGMPPLTPTSPVLQRQEAVKLLGDKRSDSFQVVSTDASGEQRLVGVPHGGVCEQQAFVGTDGLGKSLGTLLRENVTPTRELSHLWK